ncbi:hypothetical protein IscW_ISCW006273 [Ixodes scapularis]|uniref:DNA mismatch repair proteins mutS family domain-containing protein n=1 Tax=Ixodes scapularis TaxID=6945 RepID=B7PQD0_IXOSC|nr:hypothetical protein IscW_ISCW006273 [Ixodes scapularis]|eukprot:XP_002435972.1 hypothetical protein IscW_ISCW006273 [Ixodes scapularis]
MAHIGSYVPAEAALIGPVDSIRTCMSVDESLLHGLSSFALDLQQANGIGLLVATIESFLEDSDQCPHVILATHFHLLHDILPSSPLLSHQTFASLHHQGEMVYLYQLIEGHARGSCAGLVALSANVARDVVQRQQQAPARTHPEVAARFPTTSTYLGLFDGTMKHLRGRAVKGALGGGPQWNCGGSCGPGAFFVSRKPPGCCGGSTAGLGIGLGGRQGPGPGPAGPEARFMGGLGGCTAQCGSMCCLGGPGGR